MNELNRAVYLISEWSIVGTAFVLLIATGELGWRIGSARQRDDVDLRGLVGGVGAATLGILGLLLGFALSMAISRFDARREVIVREANAIGTLSLRAGLLEPALRDELRAALREYVDARIALGEADSGLDRMLTATANSEAIHPRIWSVVERACREPFPTAVQSALIAATNEVIDVHELRISSHENFIPAPVVLLLVVVAMIALGLVGWSFGLARRRASVAMGLLALLLCSVMLVIIDLNRPHRGVIRVGQQSLHRLQQQLETPAR